MDYSWSPLHKLRVLIGVWIYLSILIDLFINMSGEMKRIEFYIW